MTERFEKRIPLTPRMKLAIDNYFANGLNKYKAMRDAGYSHWSSHRQIDVFGRREVKEEIERRQRRMAEKAQVTAEWVIQKFKEIVEADLGQVLVIQEDGTAYFDFTKATPEFLANIGEFTVDEIKEGRGDGARPVKRIRVKLNDKLRALEALGRHLGLFKDQVEVKGSVDLIERIQAGRKRLQKNDEEEDA